MSLSSTRKMSFTEQFCSVIHDDMRDSFSVAIAVKVKGTVKFNIFKEALHILFQRQPMLRVIRQINGDDHFFNFSADFSHIPIKFLQTTHQDEIEQLYKKESFLPYDLSKYFWRAALVNNPSENSSYLIIMASHAIIDGISINWLMGDLLRTIIQLDLGQQPDTTSFPISPLLDEVIDKTNFTAPSVKHEPELLSFYQITKKENFQSENIHRIITPTHFKGLLTECKKHKTSLTSVLIAAFILGFIECTHYEKNFFDLLLPFNTKPFLKEKLEPHLLACLIEAVTCRFNLDESKDFWHFSKKIKNEMQRALQEFELISCDQSQQINTIIQSWEEGIKNGKFLFPCVVSQFGILEEAYEGTKEHYPIEDIIIPQSQCAPMYPIAVHAFTAQHQLYLNFNFAIPAFDIQVAKNIADKVVERLSQFTDS